MQMLRKVYKDKGLPIGKIDKAVMRSIGEVLDNGVVGGFLNKDINTDAPDNKTLNSIRQNVWQFSAAKNYADLLRLNNMLVDEDGNLRSWNEFKKDAHRVVGDSVRYLKTEYDTAFAAAQSARLWEEIQRDKHLFPYVQLIVTQDSQTSDICEPLHNVILSVDDPKLLIYFPPNHWNCRTWVKKLRTGVATKNVKWPEIPEAFRINAGVKGEIFTEKNAYIANTPKEVLALGDKFYERFTKYQELLKDENYLDVEMNDEGGVKALHKNHNFNPNYGKYEKKAFLILYKKGYEIILESEKAAIGVKTPDGVVNDRVMDIKTVIGHKGTLGKHSIIDKIKTANGQGCEIVILQFPKGYTRLYKFTDIEQEYYSAINLLKSHNKKIVIKEVWVLLDTEVKKFSF